MDLLVLADRTGIVDMTPEAIARRTNVPLKIIRLALLALSTPDPGSRSEGSDGRRIVLLDDHRKWGWRIVNFERYHRMRNENARRDYMRSYMRKRRASVNTELAPVNPCEPQLAHVDVDVDVDVEEKKRTAAGAAASPPLPAPTEGNHSGNGDLVTYAGEVRSRPLSAAERGPFRSAVAEALKGGANDALIRSCIGRAKDGACWEGPNLARDDARELVKSWATSDLGPPCKTVGEIVERLEFARKAPRPKPGEADAGTVRSRMQDLGRWVRAHRDTLTAAGLAPAAKEPSHE